MSAGCAIVVADGDGRTSGPTRRSGEGTVLSGFRDKVGDDGAARVASTDVSLVTAPPLRLIADMISRPVRILGLLPFTWMRGESDWEGFEHPPDIAKSVSPPLLLASSLLLRPPATIQCNNTMQPNVFQLSVIATH